MSDDEVAGLRRMIEELSKKSDRQHEQNQRAQQSDRDAFSKALGTMQDSFAKAMQEQRNAFQEAINKQFAEHLNLVSKVELGNQLLNVCVGSGKPGEGRLGALEETVETLKKFRWQALALLTGVLWLADKLTPIWKH